MWGLKNQNQNPKNNKKWFPRELKNTPYENEKIMYSKVAEFEEELMSEDESEYNSDCSTQFGSDTDSDDDY